MIISIGEIVWDVFTDKQVLGGAPVNVAYHLRCLHMDVRVITRVGADVLGVAALKRLAALGLSVQGVQCDEMLPTGIVKVMVDEHNEPHFDIIAPAAWDNISPIEAERVADKYTFSIVFGTLAQRDAKSRMVIRALCDKAATRFYDVNLRPPFTTRELVLNSLAIADIVKMNGDELSKVAKWSAIALDNKQRAARELLGKYKITALVVTEGKEGAWLVSGDNFYSHTSVPVRIADSVGAGDAFFATLIMGYIKGLTWPDCLAWANQRGGYVAARHGATPPMPDNYYSVP